MENYKEIRWKQRFQNFERALLVLDKHAEVPLTNELERARLIQLFETAFELSWNVMKDYLESEGYDVKTPRESIKLALQIDLIKDGEVWLEVLGNRNLTSHTYSEELANDMVLQIRVNYIPRLSFLYNQLKKYNLKKEGD